MRRKTPLTKEEFLEDLQRYTNKKLSVRFNRNRSTYLSGQQMRGYLDVSVHQEFLYATSPIRKAIITYFERTEEQANVLLKKYYYEVISKKIQLNKLKLHTRGVVYDLVKLYNKINEEYFYNRIKLSISWFATSKYKRFRSITYGSYDSILNLVKINCLLDSIRVPRYFIEFVVFHEMLHHVCPPFFDKRGRRIVHTPLFKKREKEFRDFERAIQWEKKHGRP